jgi:HD superfamily phosphodiesterase
MRYEEVYSFLISKLKKELPKNLAYHNAEHTIEVVQATLLLANEEEVQDEERKLLLLAALFHDSGFIKSYDQHEEASCELARMHLPQYDYTSEQIEKVCSFNYG